MTEGGPCHDLLCFRLGERVPGFGVHGVSSFDRRLTLLGAAHDRGGGDENEGGRDRLLPEGIDEDARSLHVHGAACLAPAFARRGQDAGKVYHGVLARNGPSHEVCVTDVSQEGPARVAIPPRGAAIPAAVHLQHGYRVTPSARLFQHAPADIAECPGDQDVHMRSFPGACCPALRVRRDRATIMKERTIILLSPGDTMARNRDENKRAAILQASKMLFAQRGFLGTSISDIVRETGLKVGTIYTYFKSKEEIVRVIVEDGWQELYGRVEKDLAAARQPRQKVKVLIESVMPGILADVDFVSILLSEAATYTGLGDKLEMFTDLVYSLVRSLPGRSSRATFSRDTLRTALVVILLGTMSTVRISRTSSLGIGEREVLAFVKTLVRESLGLES
jgi:AcrR family transcriptional regulator